MHVGALQLFKPPDGAGPEFVREAYDAMLECADVQPMFRKHPAFLGGITNVAWSFDKEVELDYHLRQSALPRPGRVRELLELTSRLHGSLLDRHRPLWEAHLVEGLEDGRYAVYIKFHHSLLDGVSGLRLLQRAFTPDPNDREVRVPWNLEPRQSKNSEPGPSALRQARDTVGSIVGLAPSTLSLARSALLEQQLTLPFRAPRTMFNVRIGGARRIAGQSWALDRIRRVKSAAGVTVNDVVLAMSGGALRAYLREQDALPDAPLVAMVPVNLRTEKETDGGLIVTSGPSPVIHRELIVKLAAQHKLPAVYFSRLFVADGGLISYGPDPIAPYGQAASYVDRILKGEKPADLPVQAPTKNELVLNLKTAKALGLTVPPSILSRANEVIE